MMVELADRYVLTSNRESGFGRYDVMQTASSPWSNWFKTICSSNVVRKVSPRSNLSIVILISDMNKVALQTFSYFDTGKNPSEEEPERFYHGFALGMTIVILISGLPSRISFSSRLLLLEFAQ